MRYIEIVHIARTLFSIQGIRGTVMDDIANHCGISKKTLYCHFRTKEALVGAVLLLIRNNLEHTISNLNACSDGSMEKLSSFLSYLSMAPSTLTPQFLTDLRSNYGVRYHKFLEYLNSEITCFINRNIEKGIEEGRYLKINFVDELGNWYFWQVKNALTDENSFKMITLTNQILIEILID